MPDIPFLKGVNLGGWLVTERWMTPSLYDGTDAIDEYTLLQTQANIKKLRKHHHEFITEQDFVWLQKHGINALRIPVGYWVFDGDPPFFEAIDSLDWAVQLASKYELLVLIDLHGAPGSQNGKDHSGKQGKVGWYTKANLKLTIDILVRLAERYRSEKHVFGLELLNEPKPDLLGIKLRRFYNDAYQAIIKVARPGLHIVFHDAFQPRLFTEAIKKPHIDFPTILDNHHYAFFSDNIARTLDIDRYFEQLEKREKLYRTLQRQQKVIAGEWSCVLSHNILQRYHGKEDLLMRENGKVQKRVYEENTSGWFYWSYKTEMPGVWNFRSLVEQGAIKV